MRRFILITSVAAIAMLGFASTSSMAVAAVTHAKAHHNANVHHAAAKKKAVAKKSGKPAKKTRKAESLQSSIG